MALASLGTLLVGFAPSFYLRSVAMPRLAPRVVAHGILFSSWVLIFLVQAALIPTGHVRWHRRLGVLAAGLAAVMVISAPPMALALARRGAPPGDPLAFLLVILVDLLLFGLCVAAAIYYRRRGEVHKRWMLLALTCLLPPAVSRWPIAVKHPPVILGVLLVFIAAAPVRDLLARRRPNAVSLWAGLAILVSVPVRFAVAHTAAWHHFAAWLVR